MLKVYDYECPKCERIEEMFVTDTDQICTCIECQEPMVRQFPAPRGYVKDSQTPVKQ